MYNEILKWILDILENDTDKREIIGGIRMAMKYMETTEYDFEKRKILEVLIGKEEKDAE